MEFNSGFKGLTDVYRIYFDASGILDTSIPSDFLQQSVCALTQKRIILSTKLSNYTGKKKVWKEGRTDGRLRRPNSVTPKGIIEILFHICSSKGLPSEP